MINYVALTNAINNVVKDPSKVRIYGEHIYVGNISSRIIHFNLSAISKSNVTWQDLYESIIGHTFFKHGIQDLLAKDMRIILINHDTTSQSQIGIPDEATGIVTCYPKSHLKDNTLTVQTIDQGNKDGRSLIITIESVKLFEDHMNMKREITNFTRKITIPKDGPICYETIHNKQNPQWMEHFVSRIDLERHPGNTLIHEFLPKPTIKYQSDYLYVTSDSYFVKVNEHWVCTSAKTLNSPDITLMFPEQVVQEYNIYLNTK